MSVILGFFHNNNNSSSNVAASSPTDFTRPTPSKRRFSRSKSVATTTPVAPAVGQTAVDAITQKTALTKTPATPAEKESNTSTVTELKITQPFPALRLSSLSLRSKSNPRASRNGSRTPSPTTEVSPVLAPSTIITRTTSNGEGDDLTLSSICNGDYWVDSSATDESNNSAQYWPNGVTSEQATTPRITVSSFMQSMDTASGPQARSETPTSFSRRSWSPAVSRSSSPSSRDEISTKDGDSTTTVSSTSSMSAVPENSALEKIEPQKLVKSSRRNSISSVATNKKARRPLSMMFTRSAVSESMLSLGQGQSLSADNVSSPAGLRQSHKKMKDGLWDAFRTLETDYNKFQSKSSAQKAQVIRTSLLPFIRGTNQLVSTNIEPDELDRRVRVLHRWWTGLLAQLQNRSTTAVSGADRAVYLEGIAGLMSRSEWRPPQSEFAPLAQQIPKSYSSTSLASDSSRYSIEKSVLHNVKSLFTRTVIDTLAYAVDRIGQRTAPPAVIAFAGKVVAYAFFFCHGAAEVLISLWNIPPPTVRRAVQELGIGRITNMQGVFDSAVAGFPETLHPLGFSTLAATLRQLKKQTKPPLGNSVDWYGPWINRWLGRDTDLLCVFVKHYHILLCDFLPADASPTARVCAPAFILVHSHLLSIIDSAIHRQPPKPIAGTGPSLVTFDDVLAKASALPVAANRTVGENKLVVLLRDILTDQQQLCSNRCRDIISSAFSAMLVAAARKTKVFDSDACFALCDIMEETLPILNFAEKLMGNGTKYIDWAVWIDVMRKMAESDNNMTEYRLICMIYTTWGLLTEDDDRKRAVCLDWLLTPKVWDRFFCHWCPMVRAYYMRLICWRVVRFDGDDACETDQEILQTVSLRLRTSYAHHARLKEKAEKGLIAVPSTTPCLPAPGRRLIILRNDAIVPPPGVLYAENGLVTLSLNLKKAMESSTSLVSTDSPPSTPIAPTTPIEAPKAVSPAPAPAPAPAKKRWSFFRSFSFNASETATTTTPEVPDSPRSDNSRDGDSSGMSSPVTIQRKPVFKFSLEWMAQQPFSVRDKHLPPARLPATTQAYLNSIMGEVPGMVDLSDCTNLTASHWTYAGRALAEWVLVIVEYENFFERRKSEGKCGDKDVETPTLGVESLRKL
ncbi:hypothetical protein DFH27DRAFT_376784 [Peziza echinospora]|nr:hypothetical protein DFH27DRAFT_376784 [Peziza echinospora]